MLPLGTRSLLTLGGYTSEGPHGSFVAPVPSAAEFVPVGRGMPLAIHELSPVYAPVEGRVTLEISGAQSPHISILRRPSLTLPPHTSPSFDDLR